MVGRLASEESVTLVYLYGQQRAIKSCFDERRLQLCRESNQVDGIRDSRLSVPAIFCI